MGGRRRAGQLEEQVVRVAPEPVLARLERTDQWVVRRLEMFGRVPARGVVTAADVPARLTHSQVNPRSARGEALDAPIGAGRHVEDFVEVLASQLTSGDERDGPH